MIPSAGSEKDRFVLKLSGSAFFSDSFSSVANAISNAVSAREELFLVIVAGGGTNARKYISLGTKLSLDQASLDQLGIEITRLNAQVLITALRGNSYPAVPESLDELMDLANLSSKGKQKRIVVCGGLHPGQSTNAVGALIAEKIGATFVNATDVSGVYDKDPNKFKDSKLLKSVSPKELSEILSEGSMAAGSYDLMDNVALGIISRSRIPTLIIHCDEKLISAVLEGKDVTGTSIEFGKNSKA